MNGVRSSGFVRRLASNKTFTSHLSLSTGIFAVGETRPHLTLLLHVPPGTSEARRKNRQGQTGPVRDRFEEAERAFFDRVEQGYRAILAAEPKRIRWIDATREIPVISGEIWQWVEPLVASVRAG